MAVLRVTLPSYAGLSTVASKLADADAQLAGVHPFTRVRLHVDGFLRISAIALATAWARDARQRGLECAVTGATDTVNYWERIRALDLIGADQRPQINRRPEAGRFVEMVDASNPSRIANAIDDIMTFLMFGFVDTGKALPALEWILGEMFDNVLEHAEDVGAAVAVAQRYDQRNEVELAVVDRGIGLTSALSGSGRRLSDIEAVDAAIQVGVSSKGEGRGNGLAGIDQISAVNGGTFQLLSGSALRCRDEDHAQVHEIAWLRGTCASVILKTDRDIDLSKTLIGALDWSFIDRVWDVQDTHLTIRLREVTDTVATRQAGQRLATYVLNLLSDRDGTVCLEFDGVRPTSAFTGELMKELDNHVPDQWRKRLLFQGLEPFALSIVHHAARRYGPVRVAFT